MNWRTLSIPALLALGALVVACDAQSASLQQAAGVAAGPDLDWSGPPTLDASGSCEEALVSLRTMALTHAQLEVERSRRAWVETRSAGNGEPLDAPSSSAGGLLLAGPSAGAASAALATTDGTHLVAVVDQELLIVRAAPVDALGELARVSLAGEPRGVAAVDGRVIALSYLASEQATLVTVVDVADPEHPVVVAEQAYDGSPRSLQVVDGRALVVMASPLRLPGVSDWPEELALDADAATASRAFTALEDANAAAIASLSVDDLLPRRFEVAWSGALDRNSSERLGSCEQVLASDVYSGAGVLTAVTLELGSATPVTPVSTYAVLGHWPHLEAADGAVYLAGSNWSYFWLWPEDDKPEIVTHVHKLAADGTGHVGYRGSGTVAGYGAQARPMDEHAGRLRVATTAGDLWWGWGYAPQAETFVTVLEERDGRLVTAGLVAVAADAPSLETRFAGPRAYVVPLQAELPLLVLDLEQPATPRLAGWIEGEGAWTRVMPVGEHHVSTVTRLEGSDGVLQLSLHDVADPAAPFVVDSLVVAAAPAGSQVEWDETAAAYFQNAQLMALPVEVTEQTDEGWWAYEPSLRLFRVGPDEGVAPAGSVSHLSLVPSGEACSGKGASAAIEHGVVLGDHLFAVSRAAVTAHRLDALFEPAEASVLFGAGDADCVAAGAF